MLSLVSVLEITVRSDSVFMVETVLIIAFALVLFVYWFRYTVLLLLSEDQAEGQPGVINPVSLLETRETLRRAQGEFPLDPLHRALEKDYRMLCYLLDHAAGLGLRPLERFLLRLDYRILCIWYRLARIASTRHARRALEERVGILSYIAYKMGKRAGSLSEA